MIFCFIFGGVFLILISWFSGFGLGYGPIVFMLQGRYIDFKPACTMHNVLFGRYDGPVVFWL